LVEKEFEMVFMISVLAFSVVAVIVLLISLLASTDDRQEVIRRRMEAVMKAERRGGPSLGLKLLRDEMFSSVPLLHRWMTRWSWFPRFQIFLTQAGIKIKPGKFVLLCGVLSLTGYLIAAHTISRFPGAPIAFGVVAGAIPFVLAALKRRKRLRKFEEHFPEALDLLSRAVRAGHAFTTGLEMIGKEASEPIAGEFRKTFDEQNFGIPVRDALLNLAERVPLMDVRFFVTALLVQRETGGNLAEILDGLARVIRERFRLYRDVSVKTAQGKLTAGILIALPLLMMCILGMINPSYMRVLFEDRLGLIALAIAAVLQIAGSAIIWKIIHIEV
jgi:tight adherence protein B